MFSFNYQELISFIKLQRLKSSDSYKNSKKTFKHQKFLFSEHFLNRLFGNVKDTKYFQLQLVLHVS